MLASCMNLKVASAVGSSLLRLIKPEPPPASDVFGPGFSNKKSTRGIFATVERVKVGNLAHASITESRNVSRQRRDVWFPEHRPAVAPHTFITHRARSIILYNSHQNAPSCSSPHSPALTGTSSGQLDLDLWYPAAGLRRPSAGTLAHCCGRDYARRAL